MFQRVFIIGLLLILAAGCGGKPQGDVELEDEDFLYDPRTDFDPNEYDPNDYNPIPLPDIAPAPGCAAFASLTGLNTQGYVDGYIDSQATILRQSSTAASTCQVNLLYRTQQFYDQAKGLGSRRVRIYGSIYANQSTMPGQPPRLLVDAIFVLQ